jgi:hypothetical protein
MLMTPKYVLQQQEHEQKEPQETAPNKSDKSEVNINNQLHPLHVSNRDLRIVPDGWTPSDADPNDVLSHYDLRLKAVD